MKSICLILACCFALPALAQETLPKGIVKEKPSEGFFVETEQGFMVPYTETIPGTDTKFEMVPIPAGTFFLGSTEDEEDRSDDEGPQVCIEVAPFWMGKHEVTWGEYKRYMDLHDQFKAFQEQGIREITESNKIDAVTAPSTLYDPSFTYDAGDGENEPAATMTQYSAKQYTKWLSILTDDFYRLPGEAEWEYACRAGTKSRFYFGDDVDELEAHAWYDENSDYERHDVGQKKPNPWGLYDMYGNVSEWVLDQHDENGYQHLDPEKTYQAVEAINWPTKPDPYVARGGSWELYSEDLRSAARLASNNEEWKSDDPNTPKSPWWFTTEPSTGVGFRIVRPLAVPADRKAKEEYWRARSPRDEMAIKFRLESDGKGAKGIVDRDLPAAIQKLEDDR
ncbi:MAG: SUMF1/EgtB/PvdO family nonheme iron enzyme [Pirellulaceae bacterium]|nr:SUMF1/EgtB/PvdO family nonheme iron enzyme [Pirellulaceae bacterium]MDG2104440.1 SUMF1/EgtB/PvdO family nonheme iron enzyme [Pirellulaceae bacterium]